ncbi:hypothetical protein [Mycobacterium heckeshornense]|uniref:Uncharacterized protein n=1 Tax=Mycobacterium heckeshornense TaxID=110505 RepID=A0A7R7TZI1_9MYCO|nr:hypothetical protein [Mycobacterium heckeshornense]MCV7033162.1 hypothetical protein [Mycobacterium heckeshornense]BCO38255.1 hypothetical protein MHEC_46880 [Mycobacterium heckeshornense]BCQ11107.1 hypothetical protein JMUB5695_04568 [Mycobacterium heckeshornense]
MTTSTLALDPHSAERVSDPYAAALKYRLDVVAHTVDDVVLSAGGWLYDRVAAGWEVTVLLPQHRDIRPLQILGVRAVELESWLAVVPSTAWPSQGLAVSADVFAADARVREVVLEALDRHFTEVTLWDDNWPLTVGRRTTTVQHVLSGAARAFKAHALAAAGISGQPVGRTETLLSDMKPGLPVESELVPLH